MDEDAGAVIVGTMMAVFGLIGLFLAAGAVDDEMYIFGLALGGFAVCFEFGLIRRHFDRQDRARAAARVVAHV
jgi:hypothetical protein